MISLFNKGRLCLFLRFVICANLFRGHDCKIFIKFHFLIHLYNYCLYNADMITLKKNYVNTNNSYFADIIKIIRQPTAAFKYNIYYSEYFIYKIFSFSSSFFIQSIINPRIVTFFSFLFLKIYSSIPSKTSSGIGKL